MLAFYVVFSYMILILLMLCLIYEKEELKCTTIY